MTYDYMVTSSTSEMVEEIDGELTILVDIHFAQLPSGLVSSQGKCIEIYLV